jgi:hypothetical protein
MPVYVPTQGAVIVPDAPDVTVVVVPTIMSGTAVIVPMQGAVVTPVVPGATTAPVITPGSPPPAVVQPTTNPVVITPNNLGPKQPGLILGVDGARWFFGHGPPI